MPVELSRALFDHRSLGDLRLEAERGLSWISISTIDHGPLWATVFGTLSVALYGTLAVVLTWACLKQFETVAGRPTRRARPDPRAAALVGSKEPAEPLAAGIG
jgi:hypothetical protein